MQNTLFVSFGDPFFRLPGGLCNVGDHSTKVFNFPAEVKSLCFAYLGSRDIHCPIIILCI